jgi:hypothetical protein
MISPAPLLLGEHRCKQSVKLLVRQLLYSTLVPPPHHNLLPLARLKVSAVVCPGR